MNSGREYYEATVLAAARIDAANFYLRHPSDGSNANMSNVTMNLGTGMTLEQEVSIFLQKMKSGQERLRSFSVGKWPVLFIDQMELAEAGFFYLMNSDRVQCAFCRVVISTWEQGDVPLEEHQCHSFRCPFLMRLDVGNVPVTSDPIKGPNRNQGRDVCGNHNFSRPVRESTQAKAQPVSPKAASGMANTCFGVLPHTGPKHRDFVSLDSRIRSFTCTWPITAPVTPKELALAGFFYIGM
jgi:Inhibitor of Apoptosis domain